MEKYRAELTMQDVVDIVNQLPDEQVRNEFLRKLKCLQTEQKLTDFDGILLRPQHRDSKEIVLNNDKELYVNDHISYLQDDADDNKQNPDNIDNKATNHECKYPGNECKTNACKVNEHEFKKHINDNKQSNEKEKYEMKKKKQAKTPTENKDMYDLYEDAYNKVVELLATNAAQELLNKQFEHITDLSEEVQKLKLKLMQQTNKLQQLEQELQRKEQKEKEQKEAQQQQKRTQNDFYEDWGKTYNEWQKRLKQRKYEIGDTWPWDKPFFWW